jgi:hypothetical protein
MAESYSKGASLEAVGSTRTSRWFQATKLENTRPNPEVVQQNLGTGLGSATETVSFPRGDMIAIGIVTDRRARQPKYQEPNPLPGMSCVPPKGWRG